MAPPAADEGGRVSLLAALLEPSPGRVGYALRLALVCTLTLLVTQIYRTPEAALAIYVPFFLVKPDRTTSLLIAVVFVMFATTILGFILLLAEFVLGQSAWRVAAMAVVSFGLMFLVSASKLRPIGAIAALIVAYSLDRLGSAPFGGEGATRLVLYVWLILAIPAAVTLVTHLAVGPSPRRLVHRALAERLRLASAMLEGADAKEAHAFTEALREGDSEIGKWLKLAGLERTSRAEDLAALRRTVDATGVVLSGVEVAVRNPGATLPEHVRAPLRRTLEEMAAILKTGAYPVNIRLKISGGAELTPLAASVVAAIEKAIVNFAEEPRGPSQPQPVKRKASGGFFSPDAFTNPYHVHFALKTTGSAMFCYLLYSILVWPGIHTALITCFTVSLVTVGESIRKLTLRILGCLVGAALGLTAIVWVLPWLTSITALLSVVFLVAFLSGFVAGGPPRVAYAGFQIAFAFFLCVVQGSAPKFDTIVARDRTIGILVGILAAYLAHTQFWPLSAATTVEANLRKAVQRLREMLLAPDATPRRRLALQSQAALGEAEGALELVTREPVSVRPGGAWQGHHRELLGDTAALASPLLLLAELSAPAGAGYAGRLGQLEGLTGSAGAPGGAVVEGDQAPLRAVVETRLRRLEDAWIGQYGREGTADAPA